MNANEIAPFAEMPLTLEVEMDRHEMPLREILTIRRGSFLRTRRAEGGGFSVTAGTVPIATAEVLPGGGRLAVRLTRVMGVPLRAHPRPPAAEQGE